MLTKKEFSRKRLALIDRLRRDHGKTFATRIVGTEIIACTNFVTGDAWPSGAYLAKKLGLGIRTVKRAINKLRCNEKYAPDNYFHISRSGRSNRYRPNFALIGEERLPLEEPIGANSIGAKNGSDRCQISTSNGAKRDPLSLIKNPITSLQSAASDDSDRLRDSRGDEKAEFEAARLLGNDGYSILSSLHEIDRGQPRLRLLALVRGGLVTDLDLEAARLAAWAASSKRKGTA